MKEIFIKTQKAIKQYDSTLVFESSTTFIGAWWLIYIANGVVGNFASKAMKGLQQLMNLLIPTTFI